jgi:hypothetical protein
MKNSEGSTLPTRFVAQFWEQADSRFAATREIRRRYDLLKADTGCDSYQKDLLCQRAVFVGCQLETMEVAATQTGNFDAGRYTQMVNALVGLLRSLGLRRSRQQVESLQTYVAKKSRRATA